MSGPYEQQQVLTQAPGYYPAQATNYYAAPTGVGQTVAQNSTVYRTTEAVHGEQVKPSGSSSSSASYVAAESRPGAVYPGGAVYSGGAVGGQNYYGGFSTVSYDSGVCGPRRQGRYRRQVIRLPEQVGGAVRQVRHRLPTPEPDVLERVLIQRAGPEVVEEITEVPTTPPPIVQERTVVEPAGPPQVIRKTIRVPPRGTGFVSNVHASGVNLVSAGSVHNFPVSSGPLPQAGGFEGFSSYAPATGATHLGGFTGGAASFGGLNNFGSLGASLPPPNFGSFGASLPPPNFGSFGASLPPTNFGSFGASLPPTNFGSFGASLPPTNFGSFGASLPPTNFGSFGGYPSQGLFPSGGFPPANCFYI